MIFKLSEKTSKTCRIVATLNNLGNTCLSLYILIFFKENIYNSGFKWGFSCDKSATNLRQGCRKSATHATEMSQDCRMVKYMKYIGLYTVATMRQDKQCFIFQLIFFQLATCSPNAFSNHEIPTQTARHGIKRPPITR